MLRNNGNDLNFRLQRLNRGESLKEIKETLDFVNSMYLAHEVKYSNARIDSKGIVKCAHVLASLPNPSRGIPLGMTSYHARISITVGGRVSFRITCLTPLGINFNRIESVKLSDIPGSLNCSVVANGKKLGIV